MADANMDEKTKALIEEHEKNVIEPHKKKMEIEKARIDATIKTIDERIANEPKGENQSLVGEGYNFNNMLCSLNSNIFMLDELTEDQKKETSKDGTGVIAHVGFPIPDEAMAILLFANMKNWIGMATRPMIPEQKEGTIYKHYVEYIDQSVRTAEICNEDGGYKTGFKITMVPV